MTTKKRTAKKAAKKPTVKSSSVKKKPSSNNKGSKVKQRVARKKHTFDIDKMYKGGTNKWLVLSLSEETELKEHYNTIEYEVRDIFGSDIDYFIPMYKEQVGAKEVCLVLFDGYLFVSEPKKGFDNVDFSRMRTIHLRPPLSSGGAYNYVKNRSINGFKRELKKKIKSMVPQVNQMVIPKEGVFKDLEGTVVSINKKDMTLMVRFETSSRIVEAPVSIINVNCI
jgi:hypothetical protein